MKFLLKFCGKIFTLQTFFQSALHLYEKGEGSESIPLTNGSGSGRPKNMRIRIRISNTDTLYRYLWRSYLILCAGFHYRWAVRWRFVAVAVSSPATQTKIVTTYNDKYGTVLFAIFKRTDSNNAPEDFVKPGHLAEKNYRTVSIPYSLYADHDQVFS